MDLQKLILSAVAAVLLGIPFHLLLQKTGKNRTKGERIIAEAKRAGRIVSATLVSSKRSKYMPENGNSYQERQSLWHVTYEYTVNARIYRYRTQIDGNDTPPPTLALYYPKGRPDKALPEGGHRYDGRDISIVLFPVLLWAFFYHFVF